MKRLLALFLVILLCFLSVACNNNSSDVTDTAIPSATKTESSISLDGHFDADRDKICDDCGISVVTTFDFYAINDLHGKFVNTDTTVGLEGLTTYLKTTSATDDNPIFLSSGDMWQGGAQSNLTKGAIVTEWMNSVGFSSMTLGRNFRPKFSRKP